MSTSISNGVVVATLDAATGALASLSDVYSRNKISASGDGWRAELSVALSPAMNLTLSSKDCKCDGVVNTSRTRKIWGWRCSTTVQPRKRLPLYFQVNVEYALRPGATFASKVLHIRSSVPFSKCNGGIYTVTLVEPFGPSFSLSAGHDHDVHTSGHLQLNPSAQGLQVAQFVRWPPLSRGSFVSIANPYSRFSFDTSLGLLKASYTPLITHRASKLDGTAHSTDPAVIGLVNLTSYSYTTGGINLGERRAFVQCVDAFALDAASRPDGRSVKVNVAWDESDYQIDWATDAGHAEYKRIIDRNAELGVTHVVAAPRNTLLADRRNATDSWGWEASLWFGLGERIRQGAWIPRAGTTVPPTVLDMVAYARSKGVKLLAYVYPCLHFEEVSPDAFVHGALDLSAPGVKELMAEMLIQFVTVTGAGGYAWDHDIFAAAAFEDSTHVESVEAPRRHSVSRGLAPTAYSQWRAWMQILAALRAAHPTIIMDHRQTAHAWGPWYHLSGSYAEPIAGDENPETYGVPIPSLHADHVAADNLRGVNHRYATEQLLSPARIPGFIFHQTERTADNGTNPCVGKAELCYDSNKVHLPLQSRPMPSVLSASLSFALTLPYSLPSRVCAERGAHRRAERFRSTWVQILATLFHRNGRPKSRPLHDPGEGRERVCPLPGGRQGLDSSLAPMDRRTQPDPVAPDAHSEFAQAADRSGGRHGGDGRRR